MREVHFDEHGDSPACFVCRHLSESLRSRIGSLGFVVPEALDPGDSPQAWCFECDNFMEGRGGEWDTIGEQFAGITPACSGCFEQIRELNSIARPSS